MLSSRSARPRNWGALLNALPINGVHLGRAVTFCKRMKRPTRNQSNQKPPRKIGCVFIKLVPVCLFSPKMPRRAFTSGRPPSCKCPVQQHEPCFAHPASSLLRFPSETPASSEEIDVPMDPHALTTVWLACSARFPGTTYYQTPYPERALSGVLLGPNTVAARRTVSTVGARGCRQREQSHHQRG